MIKGIIIVNNNGQARICKFFQSVHEEGYSAEDAQQNVVRKVFQQVAQRPDSSCNYLEGSIPEWGSSTKLIYRHYATARRPRPLFPSLRRARARTPGPRSSTSCSRSTSSRATSASWT